MLCRLAYNGFKRQFEYVAAPRNHGRCEAKPQSALFYSRTAAGPVGRSPSADTDAYLRFEIPQLLLALLSLIAEAEDDPGTQA